VATPYPDKTVFCGLLGGFCFKGKKTVLTTDTPLSGNCGHFPPIKDWFGFQTGQFLKNLNRN
jgi:hypothetical protein